MIKAHEILLNPTLAQIRFFRQSCGTARFSYNWALANWEKKYENGEKTSAYSMVKELNSIKRQEFKWMLDVGKTCPQYAIHNLEKAFKNFFKKNAKYPKFKRKGIKDSFVAVENSNSFKQQDFKIHIPRLGMVKCAENLRFNGKINHVIIKRIADRWFAVVNVNMPNEIPAICENQTVVGVDLGIKSMCVLSDGEVFENPKALESNLKKLKREHRYLSRKMKGSNNREKQKMKLARLYYRISCIRKYALHSATTVIVKKYDKIVIEDLNVSGMLKNHRLAQAISDASFGEFRRQIEYKAKWMGKEVVIANRWFASSKTCSGCGRKKENLKLRERIFKCSDCGLEIDRDYNAAINLANYGSTVKSTESNASGVGSSTAMFSPVMNEELNIANKNNHFLLTKN